MKRSVPIAIVVLNILLIGGWLAFELLVDDEATAPSGAQRPEATADRSPESTEQSTTDHRPSVSEDPASNPAPASPDPRFDWRSAAARAAQAPEPSPQAAAQPRSSSPQQPAARAATAPGRPSASTQERRTPSPAPRPAPAPAGDSRESSGSGSGKDQPVPEEPKDPSEDRLPPELEWISFTPATVPAGAESVLAASALDDLAGVRDIVGRLSSPSGNAHVGFALRIVEGAGHWESVVRVPEKAEAGPWQITWFRMTDKANNSKDLRWPPGGSPPGSVLRVDSADGDGDPPVLHSVRLDRTSMGAGESIQVFTEVTDEPSGVRFVSGTFQSPSGKAWAPFTASADGSTWVGTVTVPDDGECGEWTLRRLTAIDEANNQATWGSADERIAGITFYRSFSGSCDSEPPVVTRIELRPRTVLNEQDSTIEITAFIDDLDSGVANASGFAIAAEPSTGVPQRVHFVLRKSNDTPSSPWVGTLQIPRHSMTGRWEIRALRVADEARNQRTYSTADPVMAEAWFVVE